MDEKNTFVKISIVELKDLLEDSAKLAALESGGVDNWSWYGDSFQDYVKLLEYKSFEDYIEALHAEILEKYELVE